MNVEFFWSAVKPSEFPRGDLPEVAFLGRSNVGKSSLINKLAGRKVAFTSSTPGRTRGLNFYRVDGKLTFVDLPGYGWAKVSKTETAAWKKLIEAYLLERETLRLSVILLDARRGWMEKDLELKNWLEFHGRRFMVVATKIDKLKNQTELRRVLDAVGAKCAGSDPVPFSAMTGQGVRETWQTILKTTTTQ